MYAYCAVLFLMTTTTQPTFDNLHLIVRLLLLQSKHFILTIQRTKRKEIIDKKLYLIHVVVLLLLFFY